MRKKKKDLKFFPRLKLFIMERTVNKREVHTIMNNVGKLNRELLFTVSHSMSNS